MKNRKQLAASSLLLISILNAMPYAAFARTGNVDSPQFVESVLQRNCEDYTVAFYFGDCDTQSDDHGQLDELARIAPSLFTIEAPRTVSFTAQASATVAQSIAIVQAPSPGGAGVPPALLAGSEALASCPRLQDMALTAAPSFDSTKTGLPALADADQAAIEPAADAKPLAVVDNDAGSQASEGAQAIASDTVIGAGTKIPIQMLSAHYSKSAQSGDLVEARLCADIVLKGTMLAPKGSKIIGHVDSCERPNRFIKSLNMHRKMRMGASVGLQFDTIVTPVGTRISFNAKPAAQSHFIENKSTGRVLSISASGNITPPTSSQLKSQAITFALRTGASAAGPISFGAVPVGFGLMGAFAPSMFMLRPVGSNEPHRRLKGFGLGVLNGLPGGFVVADCFVKGGEVSLLPGDRMMAELKMPIGVDAVLSEQVSVEPHKDVHGNLVAR